MDHQRTVGAINSQRRKLAVDYWFNDKRPMEQIIKFTGLTQEEIEEAIKRREYMNTFKIIKPQTNTILKNPSNTNDIVILLKDIKDTLCTLIEKINKIDNSSL
jgi:ABC-type taurine transport system substrate-binding protein